MKPQFSMGKTSKTTIFHGKTPPFSHGKVTSTAEQRHASGVAPRGHGDAAAGHLRPGPGSLAPAVVRRRRGLGPKEGKVVLELGIFCGDDDHMNYLYAEY